MDSRRETPQGGQGRAVLSSLLIAAITALTALNAAQLALRPLSADALAVTDAALGVLAAGLLLGLRGLRPGPGSRREQKPRDTAAAMNPARILTNLIESTSDTFFVKDRDLRMVLCNSVLAGGLGKTPPELYGKSDIENGWSPELVKGNPAKGIKGWEWDDRDALAGKTVRSAEEPSSFGGETRYFDTVKFPLRDDGGEIIGIVGTARDVTDRKKAGERLRESEERLRLSIEHAPAAIAFLDREMRYIMTSRRWLSDYRLKEQDLEGRSHYEVFPDIPERWREIHRRCLAGAVESYDADPFPRADGTLDWVQWEIRPWRGQSGEIGGIFIFSQVITERKHLEQKLQRERTLLSTLVNSLPDLVYIKDRESRFLLANRADAEFMGVGDPADLIGKTDHDFYPASIADRFHADERRVIEEGTSLVNQEEPNRSASGELHWILTTKVPFRDEAGMIAGLVGIGRDITERKLAQQKQQEQAALLDIAADAIFVRDMRHAIVYWNKGAERIYGWSAEEALGRNADELLGSEAARPADAYKVVMEKGEWLGEFQRTARDGRTLDIEARWTLVRDERGTPTGILAVNTDVTERRAIQQQLFRVQRLESLGTLAGGIAHDLNNVLSPILMGVEGLALQHSDENTRKILEIVRGAAQRGAGIVRQVLSFARGAAGKRMEVQIKHILREVEQIIRETFPRSIQIVVPPPKDLSPVLGDSTQMHQVLMNLCVNARDAMPDGGRLTLSAENVELDEEYARTHIEALPIRYVMFKVEDTGTGMTPAVMEKVFEPFFTTKEPGKGTGLGLSTARSIVKSHGGFISVYSEVGRGASFHVYFPAAEQKAVDGGEVEEEGIPMGEGELILLVDDEASIRDIGREILKSYGYGVITAKDGAEALALFAERKGEIRLVVTDMMMPVMDGATMIRALREIAPKLKIIAASGLATRGQSAEALELGVDGFLLKPFTAESLLARLREVLGSPDAPRS